MSVHPYLSRHESEDGQRTAFVLPRGISFRVTCFENYFETSKEIFCDHLQDAEDIAEDWVLNK